MSYDDHQHVGDSNPFPVSAYGLGYTSQLDAVRPDNATVYAAGSVIGIMQGSPQGDAGPAALEFANIGPASGQIIITDVDLRIDVTSVPTGMTSFRLHLYSVTPPSAYVDGTVWDLPASDRASYLGYVDLGTPVDVGVTLYVQQTGLLKKLKMGATTSLFAYLVTNGGYTPSKLANKSIRLNSVCV